jgi:hypothetical protein
MDEQQQDELLREVVQLFSRLGSVLGVLCQARGLQFPAEGQHLPNQSRLQNGTLAQCRGEDAGVTVSGAL